VLGAVAVAASVTIATLWLLSIAGTNAQLRIEAIKVGLSVGAGAAVARGTAHDSTERRVTELFGQAVEQLGHAKTAVRLGGWTPWSA
jgi:hypothetical protein